jgi:hypothetical protein
MMQWTKIASVGDPRKVMRKVLMCGTGGTVVRGGVPDNLMTLASAIAAATLAELDRWQLEHRNILNL